MQELSTATKRHCQELHKLDSIMGSCSRDQSLYCAIQSSLFMILNLPKINHITTASINFSTCNSSPVIQKYTHKVILGLLIQVDQIAIIVHLL